MKELSIRSVGGDYATYNRAFVIENNRDSGWIFAIASRTRRETPRGNVLLLPTYAIHSHEYFLFSYYLLENSFNVFRFDGINNVGLSSGSIEHYTMGQLEDDLSQVVDTFFKADDLPLILVSQSLSFPVALKYSTRNDRISKIISIVGAVNVKDTVERAIKTSLDPYVARSPDTPRCQRIFGHLTVAQSFVDDMIKNSYCGVGDVISCFEKTRTPVYKVSSKADEYVQFDDVVKCRDYIERTGRFVILLDASHMVGRSLALIKDLARLTVEFAADEDSNGNDLAFPRLTDAIRFASIEADFINSCERQIYAK